MSTGKFAFMLLVFYIELSSSAQLIWNLLQYQIFSGFSAPLIFGIVKGEFLSTLENQHTYMLYYIMKGTLDFRNQHYINIDLNKKLVQKERGNCQHDRIQLSIQKLILWFKRCLLLHSPDFFIVLILHLIPIPLSMHFPLLLCVSSFSVWPGLAPVCLSLSLWALA